MTVKLTAQQDYIDLRLAELDQRFVITGRHIQYDDGSMKPLRGFVRSSYAPLIYHSAIQAGEAAAIASLRPTAKGMISGSLFTDSITEQESLKDILMGRRLSPIMFPQSVPGAIIGVVAKALTIHGPLSCVSIHRMGLFHMLQQAADWIEDGDAEVVMINFCDVPSLRTERWVVEYLPIRTQPVPKFEPCAVSLVMETKDHAGARGVRACDDVQSVYASLEALPQPIAWPLNWLPSANSLTRLLANTSTRTALHYDQLRISYSELRDKVHQNLLLLAATAISGQRVVIDLPDSFTLLQWVLACWRANNCVLVLDQRLSIEEKRRRIRAFNAHAVIEMPEVNGKTVPIAFFQPQISSVLTPRNTDPDKRQIPSETAALALFSSGSTGREKLIIRDFLSLNSEWNQYQTEPGAPGRQSTVLCLAPISHSYGLLTATLQTLIRGGQVLFPKSMHARWIVETLLNNKVTHVYGVPFHYQLIYDQLAKYRDQLQQDIVMLSSGAKLSARLRERYQQDLKLRIGDQYGMSEVGYIAVDFHGKANGSCGRIAGHIHWKIGQHGELLILLPRSPYASAQRNWVPLGSPAEDGLSAGILHTQDLVEFDGRHQLYLTGRSNDQVSIGGLKASLGEIETVLKQHPAIAGSSVVAHADDRFGVWLEAFIVPVDGPLSPAELSQWLKPRLALYKHPKKFTRVKKIPTSASGKILKAKLLELAE